MRKDLVLRPDRHIEVAALAAGSAGVEQLQHQVDRLLLTLAPVLECHSKSRELVRTIARAQSQLEPAVAEHVAERRILDRAHGIVGRDDHDTGAEADAAGRPSQIGEVGVAVRHDAVLGVEMVLRNPGDVEPGLLGQEHLLGDAGVGGTMRVGLLVRVGLRGEQNSKLHVLPLTQ